MRGLCFYYDENTIGFPVQNASLSPTTSQLNPIGALADIEITADCAIESLHSPKPFWPAPQAAKPVLRCAWADSPPMYATGSGHSGHFLPNRYGLIHRRSECLHLRHESTTTMRGAQRRACEHQARWALCMVDDGQNANSCAGGACAMAATVDFYVTAACIGEPPRKDLSSINNSAYTSVTLVPSDLYGHR